MRRTSMVAAALAVALQAAPALGMQPPAAVDDGVDLEKAEALLAQARSLFNTPVRWTEAAELLEKSVTFRPAYDPEIHASLMIAASIWVSAGDLHRGYDLARRAGESAHARGAVPDAAHAFMSAASVAMQMGDKSAAEELVEKARLLAESPLLSAREREIILARDVAHGFALLRQR